MILAIDVGNTNITVGAFEGKKLTATFRVTTKIPRTSDEYGMILRQLLLLQGSEAPVTDGVIIASVVPIVMHSLINGIIKYIGVEPLIAGPGIKTGIRIDTPNPKEIGPDRIVDAVGAYELYGGPILVIDFGTATTYDLVTEDGRFTAGITAPGIRISAKALWEDTAKLPEIEIVKPKSILAQDTITSMQAGLVYGQIGQTEYIIEQVKKETGYEKLKVIATGGLGRIISGETDKIDEYDPDLTLNGLRIIYDKNR
ncbi:MAG TPA: type III pantothenate kinase [Lachnospiraceae bacterium]|nr:type III pantothenate kinase [Lachnospiraceae bacterium]